MVVAGHAGNGISRFSASVTPAEPTRCTPELSLLNCLAFEKVDELWAGVGVDRKVRIRTELGSVSCDLPGPPLVDGPRTTP